MISELSVTILITLLSGCIGGIYNYLIRHEMESKKSLFVGLAASLLVPLFLEIGQSELLGKITDNVYCNQENKYYFIYAGFCLLASISSQSFIDSLSSKILAEVEQTKKEVNNSLQEQNSLKNLMISERDAPEVTQIYSDGEDDIVLSEKELAVFRAFDNQLKFNKEEALIETLNIKHTELTRNLTQLQEKGLVDALTIKNKKVWFLTVVGKEQLKK